MSSDSEYSFNQAQIMLTQARNFLKQDMIPNAHGGAFTAIYRSVEAVMLKDGISKDSITSHDHFMAEFKRFADRGRIPARFYGYLEKAASEKGHEFTKESVAQHIANAEECFNWAQQDLGY